MEPITVQVVDPEKGRSYRAQLKMNADGCAIDTNVPQEQLGQPAYYLSPGWIDLHAHVYDGVANLSVPADDGGLRTGVHLVVDAGSAGEATLPGFMKYVAPQFRTEIKAWLNISSIGLVHLREVATLDHIDIDKTVKAVQDNRSFVCGIKVRSSGAIVGQMGLQPLQLAKLAAREAGVPVMVHIGEAPPVIDGVLDLLEDGDVVTHCYHGKTGHPWMKDGRPSRALQNALDRGVKLDVGHGAASFNFDVCRKALAAGVPPTCISTDLHIRNIRGPVYDMATTMSKLLASGMPLDDVISAVTLRPAQVLGLDDWCSLDGVIKKATLFKVEAPAEALQYRDSQGNVIVPEQTIVPTAIIAAGQYTPVSGL
ncbi:amidohydrolase/deacetylase family metallohydrolase [Paenibacillus thalictri]|uniref:Amidohydrolase/deacetylase family metallohydrolase n=1 Tax=Paenibacillus thalictri TaxID=2527873 RepID=A0A4Q9DNI1_9BACL|nr:amidohydrolase/deacetylase family metallohydrolase [Paenibacillus thalictri]TBL76013.1 amidohydrolase/deacetylase family metallohydrolase [Paenibacillus thalictri]